MRNRGAAMALQCQVS